ncbi:MAG: class I SAM-dependent methyltransferase [Acidimicrobiales bacterium]
MNEEHAKFCSSEEWVECLRAEVVAPLAAGIVGDEVLELGPGPGAATGWLAEHAKHLTCLESDPKAVLDLADRFTGRNVAVVEGDASVMEFPDSSFDTVCCFTMLHHLPTALEQNELLAETLRVLRPGGAFIGSDSLASVDLHHFHVGDTYNPVEPSSFLTRLQTTGFGKITLMVDCDLRFIAYKPEPDEDASETGRS